MRIDQLEDRALLYAVPAYFDFGTTTSPLESGYTRVTNSTLYSGGNGYGWDSSTGLSSSDTGAGQNNLKRDYVKGTADRTFKVDLANGFYDITITSGSASLAQDYVRFYDLLSSGAFGNIYNVVSTNSGSFDTFSKRVEVTDGKLDLGIRDFSPSGDQWFINSLEIQSASGPDTSLATTRKLDFGTASSPVATGYTRAQSGNLRSRPRLGMGLLRSHLNR